MTVDVSRPDPRFADALQHVGEARSRHTLPTPALVCDLDLLDQNIEHMADLVTLAKVSLRPHVTSHKSAYVARRQLEAGAVGLAFAKLSEAEAVIPRLIHDGYEKTVSVLITSPTCGPVLAERAVGLASLCDLMMVVDTTDGVDELHDAFSKGDNELSILCDVDVGMARTGVRDPSQARRVVERITRHSTLRFAGVQGYAGHSQHIAGREARRAATVESTDRLRQVISALEADGHAVEIRSGGGTGSSGIDIELGLLNELQCGSYVFMDREYSDSLGDDDEGRFAQTLTIATTVISANHRGFVTVDAGLKAMATDAGNPLVLGHGDSAHYRFFGDEQGMVIDAELARGERVDLVPPHCDPTVDRYDIVWAVRGDVVVGAIEIVARGCSQ